MSDRPSTNGREEASRPPLDMVARVDEIRSLEERLISLKRDLLFSAATVTPDPSESGLNFLLMRTDRQVLAAPIAFIEEVVELPALTPLRSDVRTVSGLLNYHGETLAVIDVAQLTGRRSTPLTPDKVLVICSVAPHRFALMVDEAMEVVTTDPDSVTISDRVLPGLLKAAGVLDLGGGTTAFIMDLGWLAIGAQLASILDRDAATPAGEGPA